MSHRYHRHLCRYVPFIFLFLLLQATGSHGQIQTGERPLSWQLKGQLPDAPLMEMPDVDHQQLREQALSSHRRKKLPFARMVDYSLDIKKKADARDWGRGTLYRLAIRSRDAYSLNLIFGEYRLPPGAKLFVYNREHNHVRGAFTASNNKSSEVLPVAPVKGEQLVIEYYEPHAVPFQGELTLSKVGHDYLGILDLMEKRTQGFGDSGDCNVDINCPAGNNWQDVKHAVTAVSTIEDLQGILCTGSLVNNTQGNGHPYFLTANHCFSTQDQADQTIFYFNYEIDNPECDADGGGPEPNYNEQTMAGANLVATSPEPDQLDFTLLDLSDTIPPHYRPFFAGWSLDTSGITSATSIHHPEGDAKKITKDADPPLHATWPNNEYDTNSHWLVEEWDLGTTEGGSSGGPLFDQNKRIIGDLTGGEANCENPVNDYFAKLSRSWDDFGPAQYQLEAWLDPHRTNLTGLDGYQPYDTVASHLTIHEPGNGLQLEWNPPYNEDEVQYYVISRNQQVVDSVPITTHSEPDLHIDSLYRYRVSARLQSGAYTPWSEPASHVIWDTQTLPFTEGFPESGDLPSGWYEHYPDQERYWSVSQGGYDGTPQDPAGGNYNLLFKASQADSSRIITPRLNLKDIDYPYLTFYYALPSRNGSNDHLKVYIRFGDRSPWLPLKTYNQRTENWKKDTLYLPNPTSGYRLAFEGLSRGGGGVVLDQIRVEGDDQAFTPRIEQDNNRICANETVFFRPDTTDSFQSYTWDFGYGAESRYVSGFGPHEVTYQVPGPKTVYLTINSIYKTRVEDALMVDTLPEIPQVWNTRDTLVTDAEGMIQWYLQGEAIPGADDDTLIAPETGIYKVQTTNEYGCSVFSDTLDVSSFDAVDPVDREKERLKIYPVPSQGRFYLEVDSRTHQMARLQVINTLGAVVMEQRYHLTPGKNTRTLEAHSLSNGLYMLRLLAEGGRVLHGKLIKE
ncbi:MAG: choice-of-anchor J domain-containing protein [Bacteroidales bacterium]|nr:choice-of-anchor J domain-containing protein [Bacteroidales bacterium]